MKLYTGGFRRGLRRRRLEPAAEAVPVVESSSLGLGLLVGLLTLKVLAGHDETTVTVTQVLVRFWSGVKTSQILIGIRQVLSNFTKYFGFPVDFGPILGGISTRTG